MINKEQFTNWIKNTADIPITMSITSEIQQYPYCMPFHLIRFMKVDTAENKAKLAILHPNRKRLRAMLMQDTVQIEPVKIDKVDKIDKDNKKEKEDIVKNAATKFRDKNDLMEILQKRLAELNASSSRTEEDLEEPIYEPQPSVSLDELVEKFNKFPPKVSLNPENFDNENNYKDLGKSSVFERTNIVSETLAELYVKQGAYDKAVKIYEALKTKYPEKSSTFAELIKSINDNKK